MRIGAALDMDTRRSAHITPKGLAWLPGLLLCLQLCGCDSGRLTQFGNFAAAGTAYVAAFHVFSAGAGSAAIAASSASLEDARAMAEGGQATDAKLYRTRLLAQDELDQQYLASLKKIDLHADLLGKYFAAITAITGGKASTDVTAQVSGLGSAIGDLNLQVGSTKIAGKDVTSFLKGAAPFTMTHFEVKALDDELKKDGKIIDEALSLQEAAVAAIAAQMAQDLDVAQSEDERTRVLEPYVSTRPLPRTWGADREAYLRRTEGLKSAQAAQKTITDLHESYRKLVSSRTATIDVRTLFESVGQMAGSTSAAK